MLRALLATFTLLVAAPAAAADPIDVPGTNPGAIDGFIHVPEGLGESPAMVVFLHGCSQTVAELEASSGWNAVADELGFVALYPSQRAVNHPTRCWSWYELGDTQRDMGEAASIAALVGEAIVTHGVDPERVFVGGVSSGGYFAASLGAAYPDVFSGVAVFAGGPAGCAANANEGLTCSSGQVDKTGEQWVASLVDSNGYDEPPGIEWPRLLVWHGGVDPLVAPSNVGEIVEQWTTLVGIDGSADLEGLAADTTITEFHDAAGQPTVVTYVTPTMGHAMPIDVAEGCGGVGAFYFDAKVCGPREAAEFFFEDTIGPVDGEGTTDDGGDDDDDDSMPADDSGDASATEGGGDSDAGDGASNDDAGEPDGDAGATDGAAQDTITPSGCQCQAGSSSGTAWWWLIVAMGLTGVMRATSRSRRPIG